MMMTQQQQQREHKKKQEQVGLQGMPVLPPWLAMQPQHHGDHPMGEESTTKVAAETTKDQEKKKYKRARWGARHLMHEGFDDGFPALRERFARERVAAEQKYEYNLGTRTFDTVENAEDGMAWLRALFVELDAQSKAALGEAEEGNDDDGGEGGRFRLRTHLEEELTYWRFQPSARMARGSSASSQAAEHKRRDSPPAPKPGATVSRAPTNSPPVRRAVAAGGPTAAASSLHILGAPSTSTAPVQSGGPAPGCAVATDSAQRSPTDAESSSSTTTTTLRFVFNEDGPLGMDLRPLSSGVRVVAVTPDGRADHAGVRPNDLIVSTNTSRDVGTLGLKGKAAIPYFRQRPLVIIIHREKQKSDQTGDITPPPRPPEVPVVGGGGSQHRPQSDAVSSRLSGCAVGPVSPVTSLEASEISSHEDDRSVPANQNSPPPLGPSESWGFDENHQNGGGVEPANAASSGTTPPPDHPPSNNNNN